jgi:transglutaminase-like putative cysteine protease
MRAEKSGLVVHPFRFDLLAEATAMRLLTVRHATVYRYSEPVGLGEHRMMFRPRASHDLRLIETSLAIEPRPTDLHWIHDVFDNSVAVANFAGKTTELRFESVVTLEHIESPSPEYRLEPKAKTYPFAYSSDERAILAQGRKRRDQTESVRQWAARFLGASGPLDTMSLLRSMTVGLHAQFDYRRRVERGVQTASETLERGSGTCRDFAVLMIEGVRSLGLAARFVSGYIVVPDADPTPAVGGGATHAWLQVYLPGAGWVDFDPTNKTVGNRNLIRVAVAWDHAHVLPLWGTFIGRRSAFLGMDVAVSVLDESRSPSEPSTGEDGLHERPAPDPAPNGPFR